MTGINTRPKRSAMRRFWHDVTRDRQLYVLILPAFLIVLFFNYVLIYGLQIAFRDFKPSRGIWGSSWVGLKYFARFLKSPNTWNYVRNTLSLSIWGVLIAFPLKIFLALVINEIASAKYKKFVQTVTYAPYFISVTVLISMVNLLLAKNTGVLTQLFEAMGLPAGTWLTSPGAFQWVYVISGMWQQTGWGAVIFLAALAGGASVALLVQDKSLKRLLLLGCGVLALAGIACVGLVLSWPYLVAAGCCLGAVVLAIVGLCGCRCIGHKAGRIGATLLFAFAMASALLFGAIIVAIGMG